VDKIFLQLIVDTLILSLKMFTFEKNKYEKMKTMQQLIYEFPNNILDTLSLNLVVDKHEFLNIENIVYCGMGGSGIVGEIVKNGLENSLDIPFIVIQDYTLPKFIGENSLVIFSSYSGNTEETISCFLEAKKRNCKMFSFTSGGELHRLSSENNVPVITMNPGKPPRTVIGFSFVYVFKILDALELIDASEIFIQIKSFFNDLKNIDLDSQAKETAKFLYNKHIIIYSENKYKPVLIRFKQQLNENSKVLCNYAVFPEMNHNELVGWGMHSDNRAVLFLNSTDFHPRNKIRFEFTKNYISAKSSVMQLDSFGENYILKMVYFIHLLDLVSFYLAEMNKVDIMDIDVIDALKNELTKS
jgi:glucose/mannose-6-phosphate isomerase